MLQRAFESFDLLLSPTIRFTAPPLERWAEAWQNQSAFHAGSFTATYGANTHIFNIMGWPAVSVPCGFVGGLPIGLQIVAKPDKEALLLRAAASFLAAHPRPERPNLQV